MITYVRSSGPVAARELPCRPPLPGSSDDPDSGTTMIQPATPQNLSRPESARASAEPGIYRIFREGPR